MKKIVVSSILVSAVALSLNSIQVAPVEQDFGFKKGKIYKAIDGDNTSIEELKGKILVRQPNSPKKKDWWCTISKDLIGDKITIIR